MQSARVIVTTMYELNAFQGQFALIATLLSCGLGIGACNTSPCGKLLDCLESVLVTNNHKHGNNRSQIWSVGEVILPAKLL